MTTAEQTEARLRTFSGVFDDDVVRCASQVADGLHGLQPEEIYRRLGFRQSEIVEYSGHQPIEFLQIIPSDGMVDAAYAVVVFQPMAAPLDDLAKIRLAYLAAAMPGVRFVTVGNPSGNAHSTGALTPGQQLQVMQGDFRPYTEPMRQFLDEHGFTGVSYLGYSFGAARAAATAAAAAVSSEYDVLHLNVIEPPNVCERQLMAGLGLAHFGVDFVLSLAHVEEHRQYMPELMRQATELTAWEKLVYLGGVIRPTGLATAMGLMRERFPDHAREVLARSMARVAIAVGTGSELVQPQDVSRLIGDLRSNFGRERISHTELPGARHAFPFDPALMLAAYLQGMQETQPEHAASAKDITESTPLGAER